MDNQKMITAAGNWDTILKVVGGTMKAFAIVCGVFAVLVAILGEKMVAPDAFTVDLDFVKLYLAEGYVQFTPMMRLYTVLGLASVGVLCGMIGYGLNILRRVLAPVKEGRPFDGDVPALLKRLAWIVLIVGGVIQVVGIAERVILAREVAAMNLFVSPAIESVEYVFMVDFGFVWMFCVVMLLARIFEYGQRLQQESDETL